MSSAIFSLLPVRPSSTVVSTRIATWLSNTLRIPLYDNADILKEGTLDNLFIVNGSTAFCKYLAEVSQHVAVARNVIWVQNDYTLPPPKSQSNAMSPFRRVFAERNLVPHYWTTCRENSNATQHSAWVNWNVLGYDKNAPKSTHEGVDYFYYGAYRQRREEEFKYIVAAAGSVTVSSSSKHFDNFYGYNRVEPIREFLHRSIGAHGVGIYCQDDRSKLAEHCPATRFYEMLSAGLPMVFTPGCVETLARYGLDVSTFVLTRNDRTGFLQDKPQIAMMQRAMWEQDFEMYLSRQVKDLYATLD